MSKNKLNQIRKIEEFRIYIELLKIAKNGGLFNSDELDYIKSCVVNKAVILFEIDAQKVSRYLSKLLYKTHQHLNIQLAKEINNQAIIDVKYTPLSTIQSLF